MQQASDWIQKLNLIRHPEGGWYRETYRSPERIAAGDLPKRFEGDRSFATSIYFLLDSEDFSALHRIRSDETWYFHTGAALKVVSIDFEGVVREQSLGLDSGQGQVPQIMIPAGHWFGASVEAPDSFALVSCGVAPGFDFEDFEMADRGTLLGEYPQHRTWIEKLTRGQNPVS